MQNRLPPTPNRLDMRTLMHPSTPLESFVDRTEGGFHIVKRQRCDEILKAVHEIPDHISKARVAKSNMRLLGTVPNILAVQWAREAGVKLFSREWSEVARKKLESGEFRGLRIEY